MPSVRWDDLDCFGFNLFKFSVDLAVVLARFSVQGFYCEDIPPFEVFAVCLDDFLGEFLVLISMFLLFCVFSSCAFRYFFPSFLVGLFRGMGHHWTQWSSLPHLKHS